jgi:hypothetical protein
MVGALAPMNIGWPRTGNIQVDTRAPIRPAIRE